MPTKKKYFQLLLAYKIHSKQTNHPTSILGTKVTQNNLDTSNKIIKKESSKRRIIINEILPFKTNPIISKTNLIFPSSDKTICCHIRNNEYSSKLHVMFQSIFGLNELNVSTEMILTSEQKMNLIDFICKELYHIMIFHLILI